MTRTTVVLALIAAAVGSFALSWGLTWVVVRVSRRIGFVDKPGGHKSHLDPTPYGGGIAIFLAAWLPMALFMLIVSLAGREWWLSILGDPAVAYVDGVRSRVVQAWMILAGGLVIHLMGLMDDIRPLGAVVKLAILVLVGAAVSTWGGVRIVELWGPVVAVMATIVWLVIVTNAMNFLDNMDGLSAGVAAICMAFLIVCGSLAGQLLVPAMACVFLGAISGFLAHNFPPARIFMGDSGSLLIGYMLATTSILTTYYESGTGAPPYALAMPLVILAVPLYDFASVVIIRLAEGRNPLKGDQRHFSHRLVERGLSRRSAVLTIYLATGATALAATLLPGATLRETITIGVVVLAVLTIIAILEAPLRNSR